ncbi:MAG: methyltransferase domain-containing protein [Candidatus Eremiobacteraeota bacterium]|nr:methyltransferase domain-containing protein [Candidatus Eremiobacteraeota bacterium]
MTTCPVCGSNDLELLLERHRVPISQNGVLRDPALAVDVVRGELRMLVCQTCGFVFNERFDPDKVPYGASYDNNQLCSPLFTAHVDGILEYLVTQRSVRNSRVVEVGCGNGAFVRKLVADPANSNTGYGFDPSYQGPEEDLGGRLRFERKYYDRAASALQADVVVCRHVIEHVKEPLALLSSVREALASSPSPRLFFETPCVEWILRGRVIWDFFYEHCSLFSKESLTTAFERSGFSVDRVRHVFEGQYLLLEATVGENARNATPRPGHVPALAREYKLDEARFVADWSARIRALSADAKLAVWGAGAKGVTFVNLLDPNHELIDCVVDINPNKQGAFIPGTGHPVVDYRTLRERGVSRAILMNPNYADENAALLRDAGLDVELIA